MNKTLMIVLDGCAPYYLDEQTTPNMLAMGRDGFYKHVLSAIPSVTNVNHATILTGALPSVHGVAGNYFYDPQTGEQGFVEGPEHLKKETILDAYAARGLYAAMLCVKGKVAQVFGSPARTVLSAQRPDGALLSYLGIGAPPDVFAPEASGWLLEACLRLIEKDDPDLIYLTTNDYMMHNYAPETKEARAHMSLIDGLVGRIYALNKAREIYITADHGMGKKSRLVNMQKKLSAAGFDTVCLPPIKDRYLENHIYQEGGALYVYSKASAQNERLFAYLSALPFVDRVYGKEEAAKEFGLPVDQIGDYFLLCGADAAFAQTREEELFTPVRTHGSLYERTVPLIAVNARRGADAYAYSRDIARYILKDIEGKTAEG